MSHNRVLKPPIPGGEFCDTRAEPLAGHRAEAL